MSKKDLRKKWKSGFVYTNTCAYDVRGLLKRYMLKRTTKRKHKLIDY